MFGEELMLGQIEMSVDDKGRIIIPASTKREVGEKLILIYDEVLNVYEVYSLNKLSEKFQTLNNLILNAKNKREENIYKKRLYQFSKSILRSQKIDLQVRISMGKEFKEIKKVLCIGAYDHLIIEPVKNRK